MLSVLVPYRFAGVGEREGLVISSPLSIRPSVCPSRLSFPFFSLPSLEIFTGFFKFIIFIFEHVLHMGMK